MICEKCGATIPEGWPRCTECGAPVPAASSGSPGQGAEDDVFPLLAAANLSRIRGQFDEAEKRTIEVLRRFPNSPAAHSLLGEIFEDQGRFDDAITWYQLALELEPTNEKDRSLLARVLKRQSDIQNRAQASQSGASQSPAPLPRWHRFTEPPLSLWLLGIALLLAAILAFVAVDEAMRVRQNPAGASQPPVVIGSPGPANTTTSGITSATVGATQTAPNNQAAPVRPGPSTSPIGGGETPDEMTIQQRLNAPRYDQPALTVESVLGDPRTQGSYYRIAAQLSQPLDPQTARSTILRAASSLVAAAGALQLQMVTIRITGSVGDRPAELLFVADAQTSAFANLDPNAAPPFQNAWWSAEIGP